MGNAKREIPIYPDNQLEQLYHALEGEPTGSFIIDDLGRRLKGVIYVGTPGITRTAILQFEYVELEGEGEPL